MTVYVGGIRFYHPIQIGDLVEVQAKVIYTGRTSMHSAVDVWARDPKAEEATQATHCIIIFVALGEDGRPIDVPAWQPETDADIALESYAKRLIDLRKGIEEMQEYLG